MYKRKISGGLNPRSDRALAHAERFYNGVRNKDSSYDVYLISNRTGFTFEEIALVKSYIFLTKHELSGKIDYFYPSFEMAESWKRLSSKNGNYCKHDVLLLLYHELYEIKLILLEHYTQQQAHRIASQEYDYQAESDLYYKKLGF